MGWRGGSKGPRKCRGVGLVDPQAGKAWGSTHPPHSLKDDRLLRGAQSVPTRGSGVIFGWSPWYRSTSAAAGSAGAGRHRTGPSAATGRAVGAASCRTSCCASSARELCGVGEEEEDEDDKAQDDNAPASRGHARACEGSGSLVGRTGASRNRFGVELRHDSKRTGRASVRGGHGKTCRSAMTQRLTVD